MKQFIRDKWLLLTTIFFIVLSSCTAQPQKSMVNTTVVKNVEISRYAGLWYELARFDHRFERELVGVTAKYTLREDGKIDVLNSGYEKTIDGNYRQTKGWAKIPDKNKPGILKVYFFLWFGAPYYIMELDANYQWALVGSSSEKYLWILSRTAKIEESTYNHIVTLAKERGYDTSKLIRVLHK